MSPKAPNPDDAFTLEVRAILEGRFFQGSPADRLHQNIVDMVRDLTRATATQVARDTPYRSGKLAGSMYGTLRRQQLRGFTGATEVRGFGRSRLSDNKATSYVTWIERGTRRTPSGGIAHARKKYGMFAKARRRLNQFRPEVAQILKGVAE